MEREFPSHENRPTPPSFCSAFGGLPEAAPCGSTGRAGSRRQAATCADGFTGVWCLNKEPDGSYLYLALESSGRAFSTVGGGTEGTWEKTKDGALCKWPDGWNDLISVTNDGFQKRSWVGSAEQNTTPPDISPALRVGGTRFFIAP